jgi:hypothetical protein
MVTVVDFVMVKSSGFNSLQRSNTQRFQTDALVAGYSLVPAQLKFV